MQANRLFGFFQLTREKTNSIILAVLTAFSVYTGQASIFYIIYLFWWNEFLTRIINRIFDQVYTRKKDPFFNSKTNSIGLLIFIYWLFIVVFFGLIANWKNKEIMMINFGVFFFKNLYFNLNLLYFILDACLFNIQGRDSIPPKVTGGFTTNMIVLHISIILGACINFFVLSLFPDTFTPENRWNAVLVIAPFLILRICAQMLLKNTKTP
jgi:hypothetical protein